MAKVFRFQIPEHIINSAPLNQSIEALPKNYNFEIHKTVHHIIKFQIKRVALQMPEGLHMFACTISDILTEATGVETVILCDVTYGACCVDDYTATALGCDMLVHYGHSCLVPIDKTNIRTLYVFVDIRFDLMHFVNIINENLPKNSRIALFATIQFVASAHAAKSLLTDFQVVTPQAKPLSPGEILGCTSPKLSSDFDCIVYLGDGKFHLESVLIHNPSIKAYRYDPYTGIMTLEEYDHADMLSSRLDAITKAKKSKKWGLILGTLGRQGSPKILDFLLTLVDPVICLMSEISPARLSEFQEVDAWIQIACPRLSIDWGRFFPKPLLSPYEAAVALGVLEWEKVYPMDFYAKNTNRPWTVNCDVSCQKTA